MMRCLNEADTVHVIDEPAWGFRAELTVCDDHEAYLQGGERWTWDRAIHRIRVGADAD